MSAAARFGVSGVHVLQRLLKSSVMGFPFVVIVAGAPHAAHPTEFEAFGPD
jgi:hypothetical protein